MKEEAEFNEWFKEFRRLMVEEFGFSHGKPDSFYGDQESRRDQFENGLSPCEALVEELADAER